jgi:hypothetical protein
MRLRMLAAPIARVVEDRGRRPGAAERLIVADVDRKRPFDRTFKCVGEWAIV